MGALEKSLKNLDDSSLIKKIDKNRELVLSILYDRCEKKIYYKALSILKNKEEAMDLSHDIFIKVFTNLHKFQGRSKFSLWVHSISFNTCVKYFNDKKKIELFHDPDKQEAIEDNSEGEYNQKLLLELNLDTLEEFIGNLKEEERMIILMKYMDGLTIKEMSEITQLKESNIKMKLKRTREKLHVMYQKNHLTNA